MAHDPGLRAKTLEDQAQFLVKETRSKSKRLESGKEKKRNTENWQEIKIKKIMPEIITILKKNHQEN